MSKIHRGLVWLASYPKSGNTWIRIFLSNLLDLMDNSESAPHGINDIGEMCVSIADRKLYENVIDCEWSKISNEGLLSHRVNVQQYIYSNYGKIVFCKTHSMFLDTVNEFYFDTSLSLGGVYVIRDPRSIIPSMSRHYGVSIDTAVDMINTEHFTLTKDEHSCGEVLGSWSENIESWTMADRINIHVVRYEDMVLHPVSTFEGIAKYLCLTPSIDILNKAIAHSDILEVRRQESLYGFLERPLGSPYFFGDGRIGVWSDFLTSDQVEKIEKRHYQQMHRFGYL